MTDPPPLSPTFRDGIRAVRCAACGSQLRDATDAPSVSVRVRDVEQMLDILKIVLPMFPEIARSEGAQTLVRRLANAIGYPVPVLTD